MYIFRHRDSDGTLVTLADESKLRAKFGDRHKQIGKIGPFPHVQRVGADRSRLEVFAEEMKDDRGRKVASSYRLVRFPTTEVRRHCRRLKPADAQAIVEAEERIEEARRLLFERQAERAGIVKAAWRRAESLYTSDIEKLAEAREQEIS